MTEQNYDVLLQTPLGGRHGKLSAKRDGSALTGTLSILGHTQPFAGTVNEQGDCNITGTFITLLRTVQFHAAGRISESAVQLELKEERGRFALSGRACSQEGEA